MQSRLCGHTHCVTATLYLLRSLSSGEGNKHLVMAAPPAMMFYRCIFDLLFSPSRPTSLGRSSPNFAAWKMKFGQTFGTPASGSFPENWRPQNIKFRRYLRQLRDLIANISGTKKVSSVNRKTALQRTDTPAQAKFGILCSTNGEKWERSSSSGPNHRP